MEHTRLEILKNNVWETLILKEYQTIKYNVLINKIGSMSNREISKSNTFELPYIYQNTKTLGINTFNKSDLAKAFNARYEARYYIKDKLSQKGYLIINNTNNGTINVNFYDEALEIIEKWGTMTYYDLLNSNTINIPADYKVHIKEMQEYQMNQNGILPPLQKVASRGNYLAKYPNNLNAIGDKFQIDKDGIRPIDSFNPYQSRPIFNVKALFDIAIESFGYTPYYDNSVDWARLAETYMIDKDLSQSQKGDNSTIVKPYPTLNGQTPAFFTYDTFLGFLTLKYNFVYPPEVNALYPVDLTPVYWDSAEWTMTRLKDYTKLDRCILVPDISTSFSGYMQWQWNVFTFNNPEIVPDNGQITAIWLHEGGNWMTTQLTIDESNFDNVLGQTTVKVNKTQLAIKPVGAVSLIGVVYSALSLGDLEIGSTQARDGLIYTESFLPPSTISYDQFNQYEALEINLTHASPRETVKDLLSAVMQKEGILMSFDNENKVVKMFTYGSYINRKVEGNFKDWSQYFLKYMPLSYNTDYGNEYAIKNEIGLNTPYKGNTIMVDLVNQGESSKYKDFIQNFSKKFKDVENVVFVQNNVTPYFEYTNKGLGLVESPDAGLGELRQVRADGTAQGFFTGLAQVFNVNCLNLPSGLVEWYDLIDNSAKVEAMFLIPVLEIKDLDMSEPIFVEGLGGFYIIEEIQEYVDAQTPVLIKLVKMIIPEIVIIPEPEDTDYDNNFYNPNTYN